MNQLNLTTGISGEYKFLIKKPDGTVSETEWIPNLILDSGMDRIGHNVSSSDIFNVCRVGTGNSAPVVGQTALDAQIAVSAQNDVASSSVNEGAPLYRTLLTYTFTFAQGAAVGNISEVGVGWATTGATLFSRALILDGNGMPTTISLIAIDQLIVYYRVRLVPPVNDQTGSIVIGSTTYNYTTRVAGVGSFGSTMAFSSASAFSYGVTGHTPYQTGATLGPVTGSIVGTALTSGTVINYSTTPGLFYRDSDFILSTSQGNGNGSGIQAFRFTWGVTYSTFDFQMRFDPFIPKTSTNTLTLRLRFAWARA